MLYRSIKNNLKKQQIFKFQPKFTFLYVLVSLTAFTQNDAVIEGGSLKDKYINNDK